MENRRLTLFASAVTLERADADSVVERLLRGRSLSGVSASLHQHIRQHAAGMRAQHIDIRTRGVVVSTAVQNRGNTFMLSPRVRVIVDVRFDQPTNLFMFRSMNLTQRTVQSSLDVLRQT